MTTTWLPNETLRMKRQLQQVLLSRPKELRRFRLSEFLTAKNVLHLDGHEGKIGVVEALVSTMTGIDRQAALQAIWTREREGSLIVSPEVTILRGRLAGLHHLQAALGICSRTHVYVVLVGPTDQTHLHMNLLASISALFHDRGLVKRLVNTDSAGRAFRIITDGEGLIPRTNSIQQTLETVRDFFHLRYGW